MLTPVLASALLHALAFPPWHLAPLAWVTLAPLFFVLPRVTPRRALVLGLVWGVAAHWAEAAWILPAMSVYYAQPWWIAVAFGIGSSLVFRGLHYALFAALACWLVRGRQGAARVLLLAAIWTAFELLRARGPTADPWLLLGYAAVDTPLLLQAADLGGVYLVSFAMALVNAAFAEAAAALIARRRAAAGARQTLARRAVSSLALAAACIGAVVAYGAWRLSAPLSGADAVPIAIIQGNNDLGAQWRPEAYGRGLDTYLALSRRAVAASAPRLLVWPESAVTFFPVREPRLLDRIRVMLAETGTTLLAGAPHIEDPDPAVPAFFNSAFLVTAVGVQARYDKVRLLPFAEYFPLRFVDLLRRRFGRVRTFTPGAGAPLLDTPAGRLAVVICFEAVFAELVAERLRAGGELLVNLSNDSWLGTGSGPAQHLAMVVPRAVENRTWIVRATTTGHSAIIDPWGRVHDVTPLAAEAIIAARVAPANVATAYQRWGDWFPWTCALLTALYALSTRRRQDAERRREPR